MDLGIKLRSLALMASTLTYRASSPASRMSVLWHVLVLSFAWIFGFLSFWFYFFLDVCVFPFFVFSLLFRESKQVQLGGYGSREDLGNIGEGGKM